MDSKGKKTKKEKYLICLQCKKNIPLFTHFIKDDKGYLKIKCNCSPNFQIISIKDYFSKLNIILSNDKEPIQIDEILTPYCEIHQDNPCEKFCKNCKNNICELCVKYHDSTHNVLDISQACFDPKSYKTLIDNFEGAKNNVTTNNTLTKNYLIDLIQNQIHELQNQIHLLEESYKKNQEINTQLLKFTDSLIKNYAATIKPFFNYNLYLNIINNSEFNDNQFDMNEKANLITSSEQLRHFFDCNYLTRPVIQEMTLIKSLSDHQASVRSICILDDNHFATGSSDSIINIYEIPSFTLKDKLTGHTGDITSLDHYSDQIKNNYLISSSEDRTIKVWKKTPYDEKYEYTASLEGHTNKVTKVIALPSDELMVSCSWDKSIKIWYGGSFRCLSTIENAHEKDVKNVIHLMDERLVSGSADKKLKFWDISDFENIKLSKEIPNIFVASNNSMKQLYTGRLAVGGTSTIKIINIQNYNIEMNITGHELWVNTVKVLDDGVIISGSTDKTVKLWNILEGNCLFTLRGHDATINDLIQVKSGEIICCLFNGSIKIWREKKEGN